MPNDHVPKCHISNTEHLQGRELPHLPGQPLPLHHLSLGNKLILISNLNLPFALGHSKSHPPPQKKMGTGRAQLAKAEGFWPRGQWDPRVCGIPARTGKWEKPSSSLLPALRGEGKGLCARRNAPQRYRQQQKRGSSKHKQFGEAARPERRLKIRSAE